MYSLELNGSSLIASSSLKTLTSPLHRLYKWPNKSPVFKLEVTVIPLAFNTPLIISKLVLIFAFNKS